MKDFVLEIIKENMTSIFDSERDEYNVLYSDVYVHELQNISDNIHSILNDNFYEDSSELGINIKFLFTQCFDDCVCLDRNVYIELGNKLLKQKITERG